jgi:YD repeat-containing protein
MKKTLISLALAGCMALALLPALSVDAGAYNLLYGIPSDKVDALKWPSAGIESYIPNPLSTAAQNITASKTYLLTQAHFMNGTGMASTITFTYDDHDRLVERQNDGKTARFAYNDSGDLIRADSAYGTSTDYVYDDRGNIIQIGDDQTFTYDSAGRVLTDDCHGDGFDDKWTYTYNENGELLSVVSVMPNGTTCTYTYDGAGHQLGYVCRQNGETDSNTYTYDSAGQLVRAVSQYSNSTTVETVAYDAAGNCTRIVKVQNTLQNGAVVSTQSKQEDYAYQSGRLTCVTTTYKSASSSDSSKSYLIYDQAGRLSRIRLPNGDDEVYTYDKAGNLIKKTYKNFGTPCSDTYSYVLRKVPLKPDVSDFVDVKAGAYYYQPVKWAVEKGVTTGTTASTFSPAQTCTRGQIITFLWRASGSPEPKGSGSYTDVKAGDYYAKATQWAAENNIAGGKAFSPSGPCTRAMAVEFMWKQAGSPQAAACSFTDVSPEASYYQAVNWAVSKGVTAGTSKTTFSPNATCTRGQIVTFLYKGLA